MRLKSVSIMARDISGQKRFRASDIPGDFAVGEVVDGLLPRMQLNHLDQSGSPIRFEARLDREGRHLNRGEIIGDVVKTEDEPITLHPRVMAGKGC